MAVELYPHNQATYNRMIEMFESSNRVAIVQPTGSGKSFIYLKWIEDHPNNHIAILSPSNEIFVQLREYGQASELEISDKVQMITYQALLYMSEQQIQDIKAGKIILDEFHRIGAELWEPAVQMLLDNNPHAKVLGATATPVRYLDNGKNMAKQLFNNNLAQNMTLGDAVLNGILPAPIYVPAWYDTEGKIEKYEEDIENLKKEKDRNKLRDQLSKFRKTIEYSYGADAIFEKHMPHDHGKFIVFCRSVSSLGEMMSTVPKWMRKINPNIRCYLSISAEYDRDVQLQAFKNDNGNDAIRLLFTVDRLNEGVHVKGIDGVIMLRPTISPILYLQQMGRALAAGNKAPLIFDLVNNYQSVVIPTADGTKRNVFEYELRENLNFDGQKEAFKIFGAAIEFRKIFNDLEDVLYPTNDAKWEEMFLLYKCYLEEFKKQPTMTETYRDRNLGMWLGTQKTFYKKGYLSDERIKLLTDAGFDFEPLETEWKANYDAFIEFASQYGRHPKHSEEHNGRKIGIWLRSQRMQYRKGKLPEERKKLLLDAGVDFDPYETAWQNNFAALREYMEEYDCEPVVKVSYNGYQIGEWLIRQKKEYVKGILPDRRERLLIKAGVRFQDRITANTDLLWDNKYEAYIEFVKKYGRQPEKGETYNGYNLFNWLNSQKADYRKGVLPESRCELLIEAGFDVKADPNEAAWKSKYALLKAFVAENNRLPAQKELYNGHRLGKWVAFQKTMNREGRLSASRKRLLKKVGVTFDARKA